MKNTSTRVELEFPRVVARISEVALRSNFETIARIASGQRVLPMIKADAYGHGAAWAARALLGKRGLDGFGVATLEEGAELRRALGSGSQRRVRIVCFSGAPPWTEEKRDFCARFGLTPVIATEEDWKKFSSGASSGIGRIPYELKFNTGMNRLGLSLDLIPRISARLEGKRATWLPTGIFSHMAVGETPGEPTTRLQVDRFRSVRGSLESACPGAAFHLANSATIWNAKELGVEGLTELVRPGLALYGVPPWPGAQARGLRPVMRVLARVIAARELPGGEAVGYGATFRTPAGEGMTQTAILSGGYADGIKRSLSNRGYGVLADGKEAEFIGIVSMDLCAIRSTRKIRIGEWLEIFGGRVDPWRQSQAAGTIPYEFLTSWGYQARVKRIYG